MISKILDVVVVLVVYTKRNGNTRITSARKANKRERVLYNGNQQKMLEELKALKNMPDEEIDYSVFLK